MSRVIQVQTNFTSGELDPKLRARIDLQQYYNGMETAQNVVVQPQGGFVRRDGTKFLTELPASAANGVRFVHFEFSINDSYMLIFVDERMYVFKDGVLITDINGSGDDYLDVPKITSSVIPTMCWAQSADTLIICQETMIPQRILRGATDASWTISDLAFDFIPKFAYTLTAFNGKGNITPDAPDGNITFTSDYTAVTGTAQAGAASTITLAAGASATDDEYNNLYILITGGTGSGQTRLITDYVGSTKIATVDSAWDAQPDATSTYSIQSFSESLLNQYINITPQGRVRVVEYVSATSIKAISEVPLFDDSQIDEGNWEVESGYEDTWSVTRGWPRAAVFYEGRLYFGGASSRPSTIWGSRVGQFFNFDPGESFDDAALEATLDTGRFNAVVDMYAGRNLQIFTTGAEFYIPQTLGDPITPATLAVQEQTSNGVRPGIRVVNVDGATVFVQRQGKALAEFVFSDTVNGYIATKISLLSSHLLKSPTDMAVRKATSTDEGDRLLIVNDDDGSIACYTLLRSQEVIAPTEWTTDGEFQAVGVDISDTYVVVKRTIDGGPKYYVEIFDDELTLDCATKGTSGTTITGLEYLRFETVKVIRDGVVEADQGVLLNSITFATPATTSYQIGLDYTPLVVTLPAEPRLASGNIRGFKKRILEVNSEHFESQAVTVNGEQVAFRQFGEDVLDIAVQPFTGIKRSGPLLGFSNEGKITITQTVPLQMNVLALDYKVSVGQ
jgi:hypothetical protein